MTLPKQSDVIPSEADWGDSKDQDVAYAKKMLLGRSNAEMRLELKEMFLPRYQDVYWMPAVPFHYYMVGLTDFLMAEDNAFDDDRDQVSACYMDAVERRLSDDVPAIVPIVDVVLTGLAFIRRNVAKIEWDPEFYGTADDVSKRIDNIVDQIHHLPKRPTNG